jgi:DNA-binding transcriptional LysR family regulator
MIDPLTLDQMRVLVAVAETGSFSAAARKLGRVQSAISQAVRTMEQALRLTLFDRRSSMTRARCWRAPTACRRALAPCATISSRN